MMSVECLYNYTLRKLPKQHEASNLLVELSEHGFSLLEKLSSPPFILDLNDQRVIFSISKFLWAVSKILALVSKDPIYDIDIGYTTSTKVVQKVQLIPQTQLAFLIAKNSGTILSRFNYAMKGSISDGLDIYAAIRELYAAFNAFLKAHNLKFDEILTRTNLDYATYLKVYANA